MCACGRIHVPSEALIGPRGPLQYVHSVAIVRDRLWYVGPGPTQPGLDVRPAALHARVFDRIWAAVLVLAAPTQPRGTALACLEMQGAEAAPSPYADSTIALASTPLPTFRHREWLGIVRPLCELCLEGCEGASDYYVQRQRKQQHVGAYMQRCMEVLRGRSSVGSLGTQFTATCHCGLCRGAFCIL